jgi:hypothetical protein
MDLSEYINEQTRNIITFLPAKYQIVISISYIYRLIVLSFIYNDQKFFFNYFLYLKQVLYLS